MSSTQILDGKKVKDHLLRELKQRYEHLAIKLHLVVIQIGNYQENELYLRQKRKMAEYLGVHFTEVSYSITEPSSTILKEIEKMNRDPNIHGIMIQSPVPKHLSFLELVDAIDPKKDVDALTSYHQKDIEPKIIPATVRGVLELLKYYQLLPQNKKIVVIGKSILVGLPLFKILEKKNEVILCDSKTEDIEEKIKEATYIFIAIGKPKWLKRQMIQENTVIIDVGTTLRNGKLLGDCDYIEVLGYAKAVTPVPGGVGPLTVVSLFKNLIDLYDRGK
ncbi:MAG: bifunctional 5,10-methylenetetrahydrofolate dehydrogenase/5,10-methenyltetrahydrofolate cyclohydrolase [Bacilli bacterium]|nr:bifunctional 5,10-methylenetetrahydrofolate dehydrogenase/5,10-methenyltetrahydrofolate cyclohydrolase [Bacilli bacterium]